MPAKLTPAQKAEILAERAKTDPARQYQPAPTLLRYHQSDALHRAIAAVNQIGKTTALMVELVWRARRIHPYRPELNGYSTVSLVVVPSRAQASTVWGHRLLKASGLKGEIGKHPFIPKREILKVHNAYSPSGPFPGKIELKNGSVIIFALSGDVNGWKRIEGLAIGNVFRDEADGTEDMSDELQPRLLKAQSCNLDGSMPGAGGQHWSATATKPAPEWREFRERCEKGIVTPVGRYELFRPDPNENPAVDPRARAAMALSMSAESFAVRGIGDADAEDSLLIWKQWDREKHVRKTPYQESIDDNLWVSYDPGWRHPVGLLFVAINKQEPFKLHVVGFHNYKFGTIRDHVQTIREFADGRVIEGIVCDPSTHKHLPQGVQYISLFENELNDQRVGFRFLNVGRNRHADTTPAMAKYLDEGLIDVDPSMFGFDEFVKDIENYQWDAKALTPKIKGKAKGGDEGSDCGRYLVSRAPGWVDRGPNPRRAGARTAVTDSDPYAGMSDEQRIHAQRLAESSDLMDDQPALGTVPFGIQRW